MSFVLISSPLDFATLLKRKQSVLVELFPPHLHTYIWCFGEVIFINQTNFSIIGKIFVFISKYHVIFCRYLTINLTSFRFNGIIMAQKSAIKYANNIST